MRTVISDAASVYGFLFVVVECGQNVDNRAYQSTMPSETFNWHAEFGYYVWWKGTYVAYPSYFTQLHFRAIEFYLSTIVTGGLCPKVDQNMTKRCYARLESLRHSRHLPT